MNCYPFIEAEKAQRRNVKRACELLKVSRSAYYAARGAEPRPASAQDAELAAQVKAVHEESKGRYGAPRVHAQLRAAGPAALPQAGRPADARQRPAGPGGEAVEEDHDPRPGRRGAGRPDPPGLHRRRLQAQHPLVRRHHLHRHLGRLALPGHGHRHRLPPGRRLRPRGPPAHRADRRRPVQRGRGPGPRSRA